MKCARTRLRKNKRQQFCLLQDSLEKNIVDGKSLYRLTRNLYQKLEETNILGLSNSKNPHIRVDEMLGIGSVLGGSTFLSLLLFFPVHLLVTTWIEGPVSP